MILKIPVEDRVSTYPGRIILTPVPGKANTYDMVRADDPVAVGTPINKQLFDNKAYTLTDDVTIYVETYGNDVDGDGSADAPFRTIQKAIDELPKHLGGHTAEIAIGYGVYNERIVVKDFMSGRLVIGRTNDTFTINGIDVINSSFVETNIPEIKKVAGSSTPLFVVKDGSNVCIGSIMSIDGVDANIMGIVVEKNSHLITENDVTLIVDNCSMAVTAQWCSFVSINEITGAGNVFGVSATQGSIISYKTDTLAKSWSNNAASGGLVLTDKNSSDLSGSTLDL